MITTTKEFLFRFRYVFAIAVVASLVAASAINVYSVSPSNVSTYNKWTTVGVTNYNIFTDGSTYYAKNGATGVVDYSGATASTVINSAISASTSGGTVFLKAGTYTISSTISVTQSVILKGEGTATVLNVASGVHGITVAASDVTIQELYIVGSGSGTGEGIHLNNGVDRVTIQNNRIDTAYHAVQVAGNNSDDIIIRNNYILNSGRADAAITLSEGSGSGTIRRWEIIGNEIVTAQYHAIEVITTTAGQRLIEEGKIQNNIIDSPVHAGIFISRNNGTIITGNIVKAAPSESIDAEASTYVVIGNNHVINANLQGIVVIPVSSDSSSDISITGNVVKTIGSTSQGIYLSNLNRTSVTGNTVVVNHNDGIYLTTGPSADVSIVGNTVLNTNAGTNTGIRLDLGSGKAGNDISIIGNRVNGFAFGVQTGSGNQRDVILMGNNLLNNTSPYVQTVTPTNLIVARNTGFVTESKGTGQINSGSTSVVITHGLSYTPNAADIHVTWTNNPTNVPNNWWVSSITSTQFTVNVRSDPGASNLTFAWSAMRTVN